ncbi:hypothetical protein NQZ68_039901 [Dissostichus eleginoides]|nr:hypothetical protein NQZ68_039901 [Dissostichus eleginoides]
MRGQEARMRGKEARMRGQEARMRGKEARMRGQEARMRGQEPRMRGQAISHQDLLFKWKLQGMFTKGRGKRRFPAATLVPAKRPKPLEVAFHLLPKTYEKTPIGPEQLVHLQAGLGRRTANIDESTTHNELCHTLKVVFPKLEKVTGGWLLYKPAGGWGTRKLSLVEPDDTGYTGKIIKAANRGGRSTFFIAPMQEELDTTPLLLTDEAFSSMHKATCQKCGAAIPLQLLTEHIKSCNIIDIDSDENLAVVEDSCEQAPVQQPCPLCMEMYLADSIEAHAA